MKIFQIHSKNQLIRGAFFFSLILGWLAFQAFDAQMVELGYYEVSEKLRFLRVSILAGLAINLLISVLSLTAFASWIELQLNRLVERFSRLRWGNLIFLGILFTGFEWLVFHPYYGVFITSAFARLWVFWLVVVLGGLLLTAWKRPQILPWQLSVLFVALFFGVAHQLLTYLPLISNYPLALGWSETSRYYQASFYFSERLYGLNLPLSITHPSRYLMQAAPFLFPSLSLAAHRGWQEILIITMPLLTGWALIPQIKKINPWLRFLFVLWSFLFLIIGPVYYHLLLCVLIVIWGFDEVRFGYSLFIVVLASVWAGFSRINWIPVPGMIAACLMYLKVPVNNDFWLPWKYFLKSIAFFLVGSIAGLGAYTAYIALSGNVDVEQFNSAFTSDLLWNRLWPNPSYSLGIVPGTVLVSLPLLILTGLFLWRNRKNLHYIRMLGLVAVMLVLFVGGLVVSVKIGGGTNLHNMDAYLVILWIFGAFVFFDAVKQEDTFSFNAPDIASWILILLISVPVGFAVIRGGPWPQQDENAARKLLLSLDYYAEQFSETEGKILFIAERQILFFDMLETEVKLVPEYERLFLMEMVISHNESYLNRFYDDIAAQEFDLIVVTPLKFNLLDEASSPLASENNEWVKLVNAPLACAYQPSRTYNSIAIQLLVPKVEISCRPHDFYENIDN